MSTPRLQSRPRRQSSRSRGQSLVEFALILPIILGILVGILDGGFMLFSRMTIINATREGARWAVVQKDVTKIEFNTGGGLKEPGGAIGANLQGLAWGKVTVNVSCIRAAGGACDFGTLPTPDAVKGDSIIVSTTYTYDSFFTRFFGPSTPLGTHIRMVLEVPTS